MTDSNALDIVAEQTETTPYIYRLTANGSALGMNTNDTFCFIPASESDIRAATEAYINAVKAQLTIDGLVDASETFTAIAGTEGAKEYKDLVAANSQMGELSTIEAVNNAKRNSAGSSSAALIAAVHKILDTHVTRQHVQLSTFRPNDNAWTNRFYLADDGQKLVGITDQTSVATLWTITKTQNGYTLTNEKTGRHVGFGEDADNASFPTTDGEPQEYSMTYRPHLNGFAIYKVGTNPDNDERRAFHIGNGSTGAVIKWSAKEVTPNSHWTLEALSDAEYTAEAINGVLALTIKGGFTDYAQDKVVTITKRGPSAATRQTVGEDGTITIPMSDFTDGEVTLDDSLQAGNYTLNIPAGLVLTNGKPNRSTTYDFSITSKGSTTLIERIEASETGKAGIFDLQGRKVVNPSHGIYIVNGKKIIL